MAMTLATRRRRTKRRIFDMTGVVGFVCAMLLASSHTGAQDLPKMRLRIGPVILVEPSMESPVVISVEPADAAPPRSYLRIRGLPPTVGLSDGHVLAPGLWAVPLRAVPDLRIIVPPGIAQRTAITLTLVSLDGAVLSEVTTELVVAPPAKLAGQVPQVPVQSEQVARANTLQGLAPLGGPLRRPPSPSPRGDALLPVRRRPPQTLTLPEARLPQAAALQPPHQLPLPLPGDAADLSMSPEDRQRLQRLVDRGDEQLAEGAVAAARLLYTRAADAVYRKPHLPWARPMIQPNLRD